MRSASTARQPVSASSASSAPMSQEAPTDAACPQDKTHTHATPYPSVRTAKRCVWLLIG
jgi:hypothetical protein